MTTTQRPSTYWSTPKKKKESFSNYIWATCTFSYRNYKISSSTNRLETSLLSIRTGCLLCAKFEILTNFIIVFLYKMKHLKQIADDLIAQVWRAEKKTFLRNSKDGERLGYLRALSAVYLFATMSSALSSTLADGCFLTRLLILSLLVVVMCNLLLPWMAKLPSTTTTTVMLSTADGKPR